MSYTKITTSFKDHETVLTAAHLQHMENGIADNDAALVNRVRTDVNNQGLSVAQKSNARMNIDAPSTAEMTAAVAAEADLRSAADAAMETKTDGIQDEVDQAKEDITDLQSISSSMVKTKTVTGNPLTIKDALAGKAKKLVVSLEPKQDLNGYSKPWAGGTGKNLITLAGMDMDKTVSGITLSSNGSELTIKGTATAEVQTNATLASQYAQMPMGPFPAGTYTIKATGFEWQNTNDRLLINARYSDNSNVENAYSKRIGGNSSGAVTFTATQAFKFGLFMALQSGSSFDCTVQVQFEVGSTATDYEPYENICSIDGYNAVEVNRTGKNLLNITAVTTELNGLVFDVKSDGTITVNGTATAQTLLEVGYSESLPGSDRTLWGIPDGASTETYFMTRNGSSGNTYVNGIALDNEGVVQPRIYVRSGVTCKNIVFRPAIYVTSEMSTLSVDISSIAGGIAYGGAVTINADGSGKLTVDRVMYTLSDLTNLAYDSSNGWFYVNKTKFPNGHDPQAPTSASDIVAGVISSFTEAVSRNDLPAASLAICIGTNAALLIKTGHTTVAALLAAYGAETVCYPLATPLTFTLTAAQLTILLGANYIWTSGTKIELAYPADKYGESDKLLSVFPIRSAGPNGIISIDDGADDIPVKDITVAIVPKQNLNGYTKPWVGGSGKNLCPIMEPTNQNNSSFGTIVTAINHDGSVTLNGATANGARHYALSPSINVVAGTTYIMSGCPAGGGLSSYRLDIRDSSGVSLDSELSDKVDHGNSVTFTPSTTHNIRIAIRLNSEVTASNLTFYPMLRLATEVDATYTPYENICPISGFSSVKVTRRGKNLLPPNDIVVWQNGSINTSGNNFSSDYGIRMKDFLPIYPDTEYSFSASGQSDDCAFFCYDADYNLLYRFQLWSINNGNGRYATFTTPSGTAYYKVRLTGSDYRPDSTMNMQLELGSITSAYEPYQETSYDISLEKAGIVYGGTLNVLTGELVVDKEMYIQDGSGSISILSEFDSGNVFWDQTRYFPLDNYSTKYVTNMLATNTARNSNEAPYGSYVYSQTIRYKVPKNVAATVAQLKTYFAEHPLQMLFPLATPITYQLTPQEVATLLGTNTFSCDAGQISLEYRADPSLLINKLLTAITAYGITV